MKGLIVAVGLAVAWLTRRERNPARWPALVVAQSEGIARDAREALRDGAHAGARAEAAFSDELAAVRADARRWSPR